MSIYYTVGTVSVTNGSNAVTGSGTAWESYLEAGDQITITSASYVVQSVASDTTLVLSNNYIGSSGSGLAYTAVLGSPTSVATIAALYGIVGPSSSNPPLGTIQVIVACYATAGDNGGGVFYWTLMNTGSDNAGTIIIPTGGPTGGAWLRILPNGGYVTPAMFGATPNSPTFDNYTAFNSAITSGVTSIQVDEGTYNFKKPLTITAPNLTIEGIGSVILNADDTGSGIPGHSLVWIQASGVTLRNLSFVGTQYQGYEINVPLVDDLLRIESLTSGARLSDILLENLNFTGGTVGISVLNVDRITLINVAVSYAYTYSCTICDCTSEIIKGYRASYGGTNEGLKFGYDDTGQTITSQNIIIDDFIIEYCGRINPNSAKWQEGMDLYVGAVARIKITNGIVRGCAGGFELKRSSSPGVGETIMIAAPFSAGQTFSAKINGTAISPVLYSTSNLATCNEIVTEINAVLGATAATLISYATTPQILVQSSGVSITDVHITVAMGSYPNSAVVETLDVATEIDFSNITIHNDVPGADGFDIHWPSGSNLPSPSSCERVSISNVNLFYEGPAEADSHESSAGIRLSGWTEVQVDGGRIHGFNAALFLGSNTSGTFAPDLRVRIRNVSVRDGNRGLWGSGSAGSSPDINTLLLQDNDFEVAYPVDLSSVTTASVEIRGGRYVSTGTTSGYTGVKVYGTTAFLAENVYLLGGGFAFWCSAGTQNSSGIIRRSTLVSLTGTPADFDQGIWQFYDNELTPASSSFGGWSGTSTTVTAANNNLGLLSAAPTIAGAIGDVVLNSAPSSPGVYKWVCTTAGGVGAATWSGIAI